MRLHWTGDESWMFEIIAIISSWSWLHILVMQIVSKLVGTFLVKSSATTQAHSAVPELRFFTCQCTCAITHSWWWDGITNEGLVERLYRTSSGKFSSFHFAHSLYIHCPCQWHELLIRTFLDNNVFTPCNATPVQTVQQIRNSVPEWLSQYYAWGLDFSAKLSTGYILPKPSRMFKKARPFINYSTSWSRKLGQAIGLALLEILNIVYSDLLKLQDVHAVLEQIRLLFQVIASDERIFEIHQSDIIWRGFLQPSGTWSDSSSCWFRDLSFLWSAASIFGIFYTDTHSQVGTHTTYFSGSLAISEQAVSRIQTVSYSGFEKNTSELILPRWGPSFSSTSWCVYGLTMGAYFMFCCCINERVQLFQVYPMLLSQPYFAHRYVDNRAHQEIFSFTR